MHVDPPKESEVAVPVGVTAVVVLVLLSAAILIFDITTHGPVLYFKLKKTKKNVCELQSKKVHLNLKNLRNNKVNVETTSTLD